MTRIFYTSDIHGSERVFLKLVNSVKIYKPEVVIVGGDLSGKRLVPIVRKNGVYETDFLGEHIVLNNENDLEKIMDKIRAVGYYPYVGDEEEIKELSEDPSKLDKIFEEVIVETLKRWIDIAEDRLKKIKNLKFYIMPGNDDPYVIDEVLDSSEFVINPDKKVMMIDKYHEMLSLGVSNMTPWKCARDVEEDDIRKWIDELASKVNNMSNAIFNIHVPPYGTHIDLAPKLDENLKPILTPGRGYEMDHVGSIAVREAIEKYQPMLGLHGHVHEARGVDKIGRTICINPGSEYTEGVLRGALIVVDKGKVKDYLLVQG